MVKHDDGPRDGGSDGEPTTRIEGTIVDGWTDLERKLGELAGPSDAWIFRGQRAEWSLKTTIERIVYSGLPGLTVTNFRELERHILNEFPRRARRYFAPNEAPADRLEWLSAMQHFGAPTRLLDFTYSPYVAAFFAFEERLDRDAGCRTVFALNRHALRNRAIEVAPELADVLPALDATSMSAPNHSKVDKQMRTLLERERLVVFPVEPLYMRDRVAAQRGTFFCTGSTGPSTFDEVLFRMEPTAEMVQRFRIPSDSTTRREGLDALRLMNITRATLFPDLEGYARSFRYELERRRKEARLSVTDPVSVRG